MRKIGLIGRQGAGKDYFTAQLMKENPNVSLVRMADPIKDVSTTLFQFIFEQMGFKDNAAFEAKYKENAFSIPLLHFKTSLKFHIERLIGIYYTHKGFDNVSKEHLTEKLKDVALQLFKDKFEKDCVVLSPRYFQQIFGTNLFRQHVDFDFWCVIADEQMKIYKRIS